MKAALVISALGALVGCQVDVPDGVYTCSVDDECPPGLRCDGRLCRRNPPTDSGTIDTGLTDTLVVDSDAPDGGVGIATGLVHSPIRLHQPYRDRTVGFRSPVLSANGLRLYFVHDTGRREPMYVARRPDVASPFGPVEPLPGTDVDMVFSAMSMSSDEREVFAQATVMGDTAIFVATRSSTAASFGPFTRVAATDDPANVEMHPSISRDGLELYWIQEGGGSTWIRRATRSAPTDPFETPEDVLTSGAPRLSRLWEDDTTLVFEDGETMMMRRDAPGGVWGPVEPFSGEPEGFDGELYFYSRIANELWFTVRGPHPDAPISGAIFRAAVCPDGACAATAIVECDDSTDIRTANGLRCFHRSSDTIGFNVGRTRCQAWDPTVGAFAASIHTQREADLLAENGFTGWLGLVRSTGGMFSEWESGDPLLSTRWLPGEPSTEVSENCVYSDETGAWAAIDCGGPAAAICAREVWPSFVP